MEGMALIIPIFIMIWNGKENNMDKYDIVLAMLDELIENTELTIKYIKEYD